MSGIVEKGFSISHEFDGNRLKSTIKKIVIKEWVGDVSSNINFVAAGDGSWGSVSVGGESYSNARIADIESAYEGTQAFKTTTVEQKIDASGCDVFCGLTSSEVESFSDSISTTKGKDSISLTRKMSVQIADDETLRSSPSSPSGSALLDLAISCLKSELSSTGAFSSNDPDIQQMINDSADTCGDSKIKSSISETIDRGACSASISRTTTKDLTGCEEDCSSSESVSVNYSEDGLVSISVNGTFKGDKEDFNCDSNGAKLSIKKSKYAYAQDCYDGLDKDSKLLELYEAHQQEACETDVCLALRVQSESETHCEKEGTISWSISASEEEVSADDGVKRKIKEKTTKNGCISTITKTFEFVNPVKDGSVPPQDPRYLRGNCSAYLPGSIGQDPASALGAVLNAFGGLDTAAPGGFFGPISFSATVNPSQASINGSMTFTDDPEYEDDPQGLIKKSTTTETICPQEINEEKRNIPCGNAMNITTTGAPGSTKICKDFEFFPCADIGDVEAAIAQTAPGGAVVLENTFSVSVTEGAKTGSSCLKYHSAEDLKGQC